MDKRFKPLEWHKMAGKATGHKSEPFIEDVYDLCLATKQMLQMIDKAINSTAEEAILDAAQIDVFLRGSISAMNLISNKAETFWTD